MSERIFSDGERNYGSESHLHLFKYLIMTNIILYMEAGSVPALLVPIAQSFNMSYAAQGLLGGIVYLSLGLGGPVAGYVLRRFHHKFVLMVALYCNLFLTISWALTPTTYGAKSTVLFISLRALMGLCQSVVCVYLPLWTNEHSPHDQKTIHMSYLQVSVPIGVMLGYILSCLILSLSKENTMCYHILCWRLPFLVQIILLTPLFVAFYFVPDRELSIFISDKANNLRLISPQRKPNFISSAEDGPSDVAFERMGMKFNNEFGDVLSGTSESSDHSGTRVNTPTNNLHAMSNDDEAARQKVLAYNDDTLRQEQAKFRRHSLGASLFDPLCSRSVLSKSNEDLPLLGFRWSSHHAHEQKVAAKTHTSRITAVKSCRFSPLPLHIELTGSLINDESFTEFELKLDEKRPHTPTTPKTPRSKARWSISSIDSVPLQYESFRDIRRKSILDDTGPLVEINTSKRRYSWSYQSSKSGIAANHRLRTQSPMHLTLSIQVPSNNSVNNSVNNVESRDEEMDCSSSSSSDDDCATVLKEKEDDQENAWSCCLIPKYVLKLLGVSIYRNLLAAICALYFAVTGIQYWGFKYFATAFPTTSIETSYWFIVCAITAPTSGIFFGGYITDRNGGYQGRSEWMATLKMCVIAGSIACISAIPITFLTSFYLALCCLWVLLFFGASILPVTSLILINIVPRELRPISSSLSMVVFNSFGYCLSLILSGWFMQYIASYYRSCHDVCIMSWGFRLILMSSFTSLFFLVCAWCAAIRMQEERATRCSNEKLFHSPIDLHRNTTPHYYGSIS